MLRDRYAPQDLFALVPAANLALDPVLAQLDILLGDDEVYQRVRADLAKRRPQTATTSSDYAISTTKAAMAMSASSPPTGRSRTSRSSAIRRRR